MIYVKRSEWGAQYGCGYDTDGAKTLVVVHHDGPYPSRSQPGMTLEQEAKIMRQIESFHANGEPAVVRGGRIITPARPGLTKANPRIAYTAAGMQTGRIFEGCGWGHVGAHTPGYNSSAAGFFVPIAGNRDTPTPELVKAFHEWRAEGVRLGELSPVHVVKGHQDFNKPACPGKFVYDMLVRGSSMAQPSMRDEVRAHPTLREGKGGLHGTAGEREAVLYVQRVLDMADEFRTGYYGKVTKAAVVAFQITSGLEPDGIVGPKMWAVVDWFYDDAGELKTART